MVRNPFRPPAIVLFSFLTVATHAQKIFVAGVKRAADCEFATKPLITDLQAVRYRGDWTIVVACTRVMWEELQQKADAQGTDTAFTNVQHRVTVLNGLIYLQMLPLRGTVHDSPRLVLKHEYGHILCACNDEFMADRAEKASGPRTAQNFAYKNFEIFSPVSVIANCESNGKAAGDFRRQLAASPDSCDRVNGKENNRAKEREQEMPTQKNFELLVPNTMPKSVGYSQVATVTGGTLVFVSGQVALDNAGNVVGKDDFRAQVQQVFDNLKAAVEAAGGTFDDVIKLNSYLLDLSPSHLAEFREVRDKYVNVKNPPASTAVQVQRLFRSEFLVEIEAAAVVKNK